MIEIDAEKTAEETQRLRPGFSLGGSDCVGQVPTTTDKCESKMIAVEWHSPTATFTCGIPSVRDGGS